MLYLLPLFICSPLPFSLMIPFWSIPDFRIGNNPLAVLNNRYNKKAQNPLCRLKNRKIKISILLGQLPRIDTDTDELFSLTRLSASVTVFSCGHFYQRIPVPLFYRHRPNGV
jgi:hypothetical protein